MKDESKARAFILHPSAFILACIGAERARTANPRVANAVLSQLSYGPESRGIVRTPAPRVTPSKDRENPWELASGCRCQHDQGQREQTMKPTQSLPLVLAGVGLIISACTRDRLPASAGIGPATAAAQSVQTQGIDLARQVLIFAPTRDDITVGCAILHVSHPGGADVQFNGRPMPEMYRVYLKQVAKNQFELPPLKIEFPAGELVCLSVKVWFNEVTNANDSPFYQPDHLDDRYSLLSYCTRDPDSTVGDAHRVRLNRAATIEEFKQRLARPFTLHLTQRPLLEEHGRYPTIYNEGRRVSPADVAEIEKLVRGRGERLVISVSVRSADRAVVTVGQDSIFREARRYDVIRKDGPWEIAKVEPLLVPGWP
jgi:hypothetical protein